LPRQRDEIRSLGWQVVSIEPAGLVTACLGARRWSRRAESPRNPSGSYSELAAPIRLVQRLSLHSRSPLDPAQPCDRLRETDRCQREQTDVADLFGGHVLGQRPASVRADGTLCLRADRDRKLCQTGASSIERTVLVAGLDWPCAESKKPTPLIRTTAPSGCHVSVEAPQRAVNSRRVLTIARRSRVRAGRQAGEGISTIMYPPDPTRTRTFPPAPARAAAGKRSFSA
jgi:hypothetical protein